jgi:hypothetical protein
MITGRSGKSHGKSYNKKQKNNIKQKDKKNNFLCK